MDDQRLVRWNDKKSHMQAMLDMTKNTVFMGIEEDLETYAQLIEAREEYVTQIKKIDEELAQGHEEISPALQSDINAVKLEIKTLASDITEVDKSNKRIVDETRLRLANEFKTIRQGKNAKNLYQKDMGMDGHRISRSR